ncbi:hypothetical protein EVA_04108 [gut metagenome]|uniref:Uncharacterized protein n=1 Tax=gut metagenome TaxID=749906 RepID=J9D4Z5_9ZZZZ
MSNIRCFIYIQHIMNFFCKIRGEQPRIARSHFCQFLTCPVVYIMRIFRFSFPVRTLQKRNRLFIPRPQFQFKAIILLCFLRLGSRLSIIRPRHQLHRCKRMFSRQRKPRHPHTFRERHFTLIKNDLTTIVFQRKIKPQRIINDKVTR